MKGKYLVPAGLAELVLTNRLFRSFQIYLALKNACRGQIEITRDIKIIIAGLTGTSRKTIDRAIKDLLKSNWIGYDRKRDTYFIRGFDALRRIETIRSKRAYWFDIKHLKKVKSFVVACCYSEIRHQIFRRRLALVQKKGRSVQGASLPIFYPIALDFFSKVYKCAKSTSSVYRKLAAKDGFIVVDPDIRPMLIEGKILSADHLGYLRQKIGQEDTRRLVCIDGGIYEQFPDQIKCKVSFKKRRRIAS